MKKIIFLISLFFISNSFSQSNDVLSVLGSRQQTKARSGWTLSDWMNTKYRISLQNQLLAFHNIGDDGVLYDFYIGGSMGEFKFTGDQIPPLEAGDDEKISFYNYFAAFYISLLGIEYKYEKSKEVYSQDEGNLNLRIFGTSTQSTNLVLQYGVRLLNEYQFGEFQQQFAGGYLGLYIFRFFGLEGRYRNYFWATMTDGLMNMRSERYDYGVFLEKSFFRIFGTIFREVFKYQNPDLIQERNGLYVGVRINF